MSDKLVEKVENMFLKEGFTRMSEYFGDEVFKNGLSAKDILWKSDFYYYVVRHENNSLIVYYFVNDLDAPYHVYLSLPDDLSDVDLESNIERVIHGVSPKSEAIIQRYINIKESFEIPSKYEFIRFNEYYDKDQHVKTYTELDYEKMYQTNIEEVKALYEEEAFIYGANHPRVLAILQYMLIWSRINGYHDEALDYAYQLSDSVGSYYGMNSVEYWQSKYYIGDILIDRHLHHEAFPIVMEAYNQLIKNDDYHIEDSLDLLRLIVKCYFSFRLFKDACDFAKLYMLACASSESMEVIKEAKLIYLHSLCQLPNVEADEIWDIIDELDDVECEWTPDLGHAMLDVQLDFEEDDDAFETAQQLYEYYRYNYGVRNPETLEYASMIALCVYKMGHKKDAIEIQKYVSDTFKVILGDRTYEYAESLYMLSGMYCNDEKWGKARSYAFEAYSLYCKFFTQMHPDTLDVIILLADIERKAHNARDELTYREQAIDIARKIYGETNEKTLDLLFDYIHALCCYDKADSALDHVLNYVDTVVSEYGEEHVETIKARKAYSIVLTSLGRYQEAYDVDVHNYEICIQLQGRYAYDTICLVRYIAQDFYHLGRKDNAWHLLLHTLMDMRDDLGMDHEYMSILLPLFRALKEELGR